MQEKARIILLDTELMTFTNKDTGVVREMTKMHYAVKIEDKTKSNSILKCTRQGNLIAKLDKYMLDINNPKSHIAVIEKRATEDGAKYVITKIDDEEI